MLTLEYLEQEKQENEPGFVWNIKLKTQEFPCQPSYWPMHNQYATS